MSATHTDGASKLAAALEYLDRGWPVIPLRPDTKYPLVKWLEFQRRLPTEEEVAEWFETWPDADVGIVTGEVSGVVVVDCDNEEALEHAERCGMRSPVRVRTRAGWHLYFRHPRDGVRRGPRAGINSKGVDWPRIPGLDFRGDGGYAKVPPSEPYVWHIAPGHDLDDAPLWEDWRPTATVFDIRTGRPWDFGDLDLTHIAALDDGFASEWDRTAAYVAEHFPDTGKLPTGQGHGRNERVMRYASEQILQGNFGAELRVRARGFMREFFLDPLAEPEFEATCRSMEEAERRNHPERFAPDGAYIYRKGAAPSEEDGRAKKLIFAADAERLIEAAKTRGYLLEPWLWNGTIVQVHGYSGHGKSLFVQHALYAMAAGQRSWGPYEIARPARSLVLDFENGPRTLGSRLRDMAAMYGDAEDRFAVWTPYADEDMSLKDARGLQHLEAWVKWYRPDVVVFDTVRTAWSGLEENSAEAWAPINRLAIRLRNAGIGVLLLHHSNKPGENGLGREAGSSNQLTTLETQLRITQVWEDEETARANGGIHDTSYARPVYPALREKLPPDAFLTNVMEVRVGKCREWTDLHERVQWIGFGQTHTGARVVVSSSSPKQKARALALDGVDPHEIARSINRPLSSVVEWLTPAS